MDDIDYMDEEITKPSVFIDESKLSSQYVPPNLLYRTDNLKTCARHFKSILNRDQNLTRKMVITGPVGSGKTSIAKKVGQWMIKKRETENVNIVYVYINCRNTKTQFMTLSAIAKNLNPHVPSRGYSADELMEMIVEILESKKLTLFLVLDEIDHVPISESNELLYSLSRTIDEREAPQHKLGILMIAQSISFLENLDSSTKSSLSANIMRLNPYTEKQLNGIIEERIRESFTYGAVSKEAIYLGAEIAAIRGDARRALELMWYAGKHADSENSTIVYPDHVRRAKGDIEPSILRNTIKELKDHKLLLLLGIARQLKYARTARVTTGNAIEAYQIVCEEYLQSPRKHTQIWEYLNEFQKMGILVTQMSGAGHRGKTKLISIQDVSANELEKEVLKLLQKLEAKSMATY